LEAGVPGEYGRLATDNEQRQQLRSGHAVRASHQPRTPYRDGSRRVRTSHPRTRVRACGRPIGLLCGALRGRGAVLPQAVAGHARRPRGCCSTDYLPASDTRTLRARALPARALSHLNAEWCLVGDFLREPIRRLPPPHQATRRLPGGPLPCGTSSRGPLPRSTTPRQP
jgi:hypothetical protein